MLVAINASLICGQIGMFIVTYRSVLPRIRTSHTYVTKASHVASAGTRKRAGDPLASRRGELLNPTTRGDRGT